MSDDLLAEGQVVAGRYRVERVIGRGGMGVVVAARHLELDETFALKVMTPAAFESADAVERFVREARMAARLRSPHAVRVIDAGRLPNGAPYLAMECLTGRDLEKELDARGPLPSAEAATYIVQACDVLAEAHGLGIVHRDIKPGNLFLTRLPSGAPCIKVLDFGIAKHADSLQGPRMTQTTAVFGTPLYMSPEQMKSARSVDARSDIWSLGVVLYELITGGVPYDAGTMTELVAKVFTEPPVFPSVRRADVAPELEPIVMKCLERFPENRYPSAAALAAALAPVAAGRPSAVPAPPQNPLHAATHAPQPTPPRAATHAPQAAYPQAASPNAHPQAASPSAAYPQAASPNAAYPQAASPNAAYPQAASPNATYPRTATHPPQAAYPQAASPGAAHPQAASPNAAYPQAGAHPPQPAYPRAAPPSAQPAHGAAAPPNAPPVAGGAAHWPSSTQAAPPPQGPASLRDAPTKIAAVPGSKGSSTGLILAGIAGVLAILAVGAVMAVQAANHDPGADLSSATDDPSGLAPAESSDRPPVTEPPSDPPPPATASATATITEAPAATAASATSSATAKAPPKASAKPSGKSRGGFL